MNSISILIATDGQMWINKGIKGQRVVTKKQVLKQLFPFSTRTNAVWGSHSTQFVQPDAGEVEMSSATIPSWHLICTMMDSLLTLYYTSMFDTIHQKHFVKSRSEFHTMDMAVGYQYDKQITCAVLLVQKASSNSTIVVTSTFLHSGSVFRTAKSLPRLNKTTGKFRMWGCVDCNTHSSKWPLATHCNPFR